MVMMEKKNDGRVAKGSSIPPSQCRGRAGPVRRLVRGERREAQEEEGGVVLRNACE